MKKFLIAVGVILLVGGASAGYVYKIQIPKIEVNHVDWAKKKVTFTVRGVKHTVSVAEGIGTYVPIKFSKYSISFAPKQLNTNDYWRLVVEDGDVQVGREISFDFKNKQQS